jgi:hypothetical protein
VAREGLGLETVLLRERTPTDAPLQIDHAERRVFADRRAEHGSMRAPRTLRRVEALVLEGRAGDDGLARAQRPAIPRDD